MYAPHVVAPEPVVKHNNLPTHLTSPHLTSLYSTFPLRDPEVTMSRSNSLSTKKFSMYTGLSPKEKIEYRDYNDFRYDGFQKGDEIQ